MAKDRSTFMGPRIRRLRRELGLTQVAMAEDLDVSPSYIALIERNHRPVSADLLIRLADAYGVDIASFARSESDVQSQLEAAIDDPIFTDLSVGHDDIRDLIAANPVMAEAMAALYRNYQTGQRSVLEARAGADVGGQDALEDARDFVNTARNYFPALDDAGQNIARALSHSKKAPFAALAERFQTKHDLTLRVLPSDIMVGAFRRLDRHRKQIVINETLDHASRTFQAALQLVLLELGDALDETATSADFATEAGRRLARAALANYTAGAIMLPYEPFRQSVDDLHYDIEALARRFGASFEQITHRLTTLQKPGNEGIPFFFLRVDAAGNVSKRFSGGLFPFARYGGSCPLWNIHDAFKTPRKIITQLIKLPDGDAFFSIARTVGGGAGGYRAESVERTVALGCELKHAKKLIYAQDLDIDAESAAPIGVTCRLCPRQACASRAHPPLERRLIIDEHRRMATPFSFAFD